MFEQGVAVIQMGVSRTLFRQRENMDRVLSLCCQVSTMIDIRDQFTETYLVVQND